MLIEMIAASTIATSNQEPSKLENGRYLATHITCENLEGFAILNGLNVELLVQKNKLRLSFRTHSCEEKTESQNTQLMAAKNIEVQNYPTQCNLPKCQDVFWVHENGAEKPEAVVFACGSEYERYDYYQIFIKDNESFRVNFSNMSNCWFHFKRV